MVLAETRPMPVGVKAARGLELVLMFVLLPGMLVWMRRAGVRLPVIPPLLFVTLGAWVSLMFDPAFEKASFGRAKALRPELGRILRIFGGCALTLTAYTLVFERELLFAFARSKPLVYAMVVVLYPWVSAYPQELLYRAFFLHRYQALFPGPRATLIISAVLFGMMHVVFGNGLAVVLTMIGGLLFGYTYLRTRSLLACAFEHALYGTFVYTIGLGHYFYAGL